MISPIVNRQTTTAIVNRQMAFPMEDKPVTLTITERSYHRDMLENGMIMESHSDQDYVISDPQEIKRMSES